MIITKPEKGSRFFYSISVILVSVWNPFPRHLKVVRDGRYVNDIHGRIKSWRITKKELARRRTAGEEEKQCFTICTRGSVEMSGKVE